MFVDASAIVAILTKEPDGEWLASALDKAEAPITSPLAIYEATLGLCRKQRGSVAQALDDVYALIEAAGIRLVDIPSEAADLALDAFARYGKGRGHPAQLNMGDCFAYALTTAHRTLLLFKGNDFHATDIPTVPFRPRS